MKKTRSFNKKIFALLIEKAKGERTTKQFANDCGISYVQLHKLELANQENAPGIKLMTKLANNSAGGIELEDYLLAAGYSDENEKEMNIKKRSFNIQDMYDNLTSNQQKTVYDFMDFLLNYKGV
ncbi:MAG: hypothetical protein K6D98_05525 [Clostridiales bacterium]|nr:hypothetical protein [Clostridiales bacterium]